MSINNPQKVGNYRWSVVALLFFATTINYIDRQVLGMLKPVIADEIHLSEAAYGYSPCLLLHRSWGSKHTQPPPKPDSLPSEKER